MLNRKVRSGNQSCGERPGGNQISSEGGPFKLHHLSVIFTLNRPWSKIRRTFLIFCAVSVV